MVHIAAIEPPNSYVIAMLIAIPVKVAIIEVLPAASRLALVAGSIYS